MRNKLLARSPLLSAFAAATALTFALTGTGTAAPVAEEQVSVISLVRGEDGRVVGMDMYTPAPGWTEERLADQLRAQGTRDVLVTSDPFVEIQAADRAAGFTPLVDPHPNTGCKYGTATTYGCPPVYWSNNGYANPVVRFNDHASVGWGVFGAVVDWDMATQIDLGWWLNSCPFQAGARCVDVWSGNYGSTGWHGKTRLTYYPGTTYRIQETGNYLQLNDFYGTANFVGRKVTCHQMGWALGIGKNTSTSSCMWDPPSSAVSLGPNSDDIKLLDTTYSIYRHP